MRLDHVVIAVSDWDRSIRFYRDVMGAQVVDHPDGRVAFRFGDQQLNVHGPGLDVGTLAASPPVAPGGSDLCFVWPGTMATLARHLAAHGVAVGAGPVMRHGGAGAGNSTYFRDPDGSLLEYIVYSGNEPADASPVQAGRSDPACVPGPEGQAAVPDRRVLAPDDATCSASARDPGGLSRCWSLGAIDSPARWTRRASWAYRWPTRPHRSDQGRIFCWDTPVICVRLALSIPGPDNRPGQHSCNSSAEAAMNAATRSPEALHPATERPICVSPEACADG